MLSSQLRRSAGIRRRVVSLAFGETRPSVAAAPLVRSFTSTLPGCAFVAVDHSGAYESAMQGPHGKQLALARLEGVGKDDPPFDPFTDEEGELSAMDFEGDDQVESDGDILEAEYVNEEEDEDDEEDEMELESIYSPDGFLQRKKSVLATLRAGFPSGGQFAVFELGGTQFKATTDDVIVVNRLQPVDKYKIGSVHTLTDVMLVGSSHMTLVGVPFVSGAEVDVMVEEITRDAKVIVFKKRRRKHSQRKNGFRRDVTLLRVLDIRMPEEYRSHTHIGREIVDSLDEHFEISESPGTAEASIEAGASEANEEPRKMQTSSAI